MRAAPQLNQPASSSAAKRYPVFGALLISAGAVLDALGLLPYSLLRELGDRLARDGSLRLLTPDLAGALQPAMLFTGLLFLGGGIAGLLRPDWAGMLLGYPRRLAGDGRLFLQRLARLRLTALEGGVLVLSLAGGAWTRLVLLRAPMQYDEAYTYVAFASRSFFSILTDYHLPNNHVLHTLLVRLSVLLFGPEPWAIRLPAFTAGLLMIPAAWLAARALFSRSSGIFAAGLVSAWPYLVEYGANARGYTLVCLFALLLLALIPSLLSRRDAFAWTLAGLLTGLGFFTIPVMLYPAGIFFTMLLLAWASGRHRPAWTGAGFLASLAACGLGAGILTGLLYLPVIVVSGPGALFANPFVRSYAWPNWIAHLSEWTAGIAASWIIRTPAWIWLPTFLLALLTIFLRPQGSRNMPNPLWAVLIFMTPALLVQRPELQAKAFLSLVPIALVCAGAGYAALLESGLLAFLRLFKKHKFRERMEGTIRMGIKLVPVLALAAWCLVQARPNLPYLTRGARGSYEQASQYIAMHYQPGDTILATFPYDPQVWYYGERLGIPPSAFRLAEFQRAWVVGSKPLADILRERGPQDHPLNPGSCRLENTVMAIPIYLCTR
jgi:hypothetical protein